MDNAAKIPVNISVADASKPVHELLQPEINDRELVERCQRGELEAYEALVGRYRNKVYGLAFSMLRNEQDATDLCQEAFVRGWQAIRKQRFVGDARWAKKRLRAFSPFRPAPEPPGAPNRCERGRALGCSTILECATRIRSLAALRSWED